MTQNESYTLKEMVTELRMDMREHAEKHEKDMAEIKSMFSSSYQSLKDEHTQFKTVVKTVSTMAAGAWALITFIVPNLLK